QFRVTALPIMVLVASVLSIALGLLTARLFSAMTPARLLPRAFVVSSTSLLLEWWMSGWSAGVAAILVYLQMAILGSALFSGFWSLIDDRFDPRSAKRTFGRIVAAGTLGGIAGGALAGRIGSSVGVQSMLPALCLLHLVAAVIAKVLASQATQRPKPSAERARRKPVSGLAVVTTVAYVRNLAILVLFSTIGAGLLDYVFKVRVSFAHPD